MRSKSIAISTLLVITALSGCIGGHDDEKYEFNALEFDPASPAPDFTLIDQNGNEVSMSDFDDKVVVLAFTYTACPDICLTSSGFDFNSAVVSHIPSTRAFLCDSGILTCISCSLYLIFCATISI